MLVPGGRHAGGAPKGHTMRKAILTAYLSWALVFGGSPALLRRLAVGGAAAA